MYNDIFQRIEEKYLITEEKKTKLLNKISSHIECDDYFKSSIHNIYFDTDNNDLIINSLEKPIFKDKFRIRSYKIPKEDDEVFLEMKTKYKGVVGKRRIKLKLKDFYKYINKEIKPKEQILKEIMYYYNYYDLKPAIYIAYDRESYKGKENKNLRITFDSNLRSRREKLKFVENVSMNNYFDKNIYIMEIKTVGSLPLWLVKTLSELEIMPTSFSKYGKIYEKEMKEMISYV